MKIALLLTQADPIGAAQTLIDAQDVCIALVKTSAERTRLQFITDGSGKLAEYKFKEKQVERYRAEEAAGSTPDPENYKWAKQRANNIGTSVSAVIAEWEGIDQGWEDLALSISNLEETAVEAIKAATDKAQIRAAMVISWPKP